PGPPELKQVAPTPVDDRAAVQADGGLVAVHIRWNRREMGHPERERYTHDREQQRRSRDPRACEFREADVHGVRDADGGTRARERERGYPQRSGDGEAGVVGLELGRDHRAEEAESEEDGAGRSALRAPGG